MGFQRSLITRYPFFSKLSLRVQAVPVFSLGFNIQFCHSFWHFYLTSNGVQQPNQQWIYGSLVTFKTLCCNGESNRTIVPRLRGTIYGLPLHLTTERFHPHNHQDERAVAKDNLRTVSQFSLMKS